MPAEPKAPQNRGSQPPASPPHQQVLDAHNKYFTDLGLICNQIQQRFQTIQTDFERELERAWQNQDPNAFQTAQTDFQRRCQDASMEANPVGAYEDAYRDYKAAIQKAIATANVDDLNFTDIAHISQSLYTVSQMAMMMRMSMPPLSGPSPFPSEGGAQPPMSPPPPPQR